MTVDLDDLRLEAKKLGVKGVHLFKSADKIQAAIDEAQADQEPVQPAIEKPKEPEAPAEATPDATVTKPSNVLMATHVNGALHQIWVAADKIEEWEHQGYKAVS